jgi:hypothetical protein
VADSIFGGQLDTSLQTQTDGKTVADVLQDFGNDIQDDLRNSITQKQLTDTNDLWQSIEFNVGFEGTTGFVFTLSFNQYGDFQDQGVEGVGGEKADGTRWRTRKASGVFSYKQKMPGVNSNSLSGRSLRQWARRHKISPYAVQQSIFHRGIEQTNWYSDVMTQSRIDELSENLAKAGASELQIIIKDAFNGTNT